MAAQMAYLSNRAYAFQPYLWDIYTSQRVVKDKGGKKRSAVIPLNAFISGPVAGGPMPGPRYPDEEVIPRAVSYEWFDKVGGCCCCCRSRQAAFLRNAETIPFRFRCVRHNGSSG